MEQVDVTAPPIESQRASVTFIIFVLLLDGSFTFTQRSEVEKGGSAQGKNAHMTLQNNFA